jgi:hypothetical protein
MSTIAVTRCSENVECKEEKTHYPIHGYFLFIKIGENLYSELSTIYINASLFTFIIQVVITHT